MSKKEEVYLELSEVLKIVRLKRSTLYSLMKKRLFPRPIKMGLRRSFWLKTEVDKWFEQRKKER
jgi:prophage regulatory protein